MARPKYSDDFSVLLQEGVKLGLESCSSGVGGNGAAVTGLHVVLLLLLLLFYISDQLLQPSLPRLLLLTVTKPPPSPSSSP